MLPPAARCGSPKLATGADLYGFTDTDFEKAAAAAAQNKLAAV
jgi:hypothetical protein